MYFLRGEILLVLPAFNKLDKPIAETLVWLVDIFKHIINIGICNETVHR